MKQEGLSKQEFFIGRILIDQLWAESESPKQQEKSKRKMDLLLYVGIA